MTIALYIVAGIAALVAAILLMPIQVILYNDVKNAFHAKVKVWFKTFENKPKEDKPNVRKPKKPAKPESKLNLDRFHKTIERDGLLATVSDTMELVQTVLTEVFRLIKHVRVTKLHLQIVCTGRDAAEAAIKYGRCCALVYPLTGFVHAATTVAPKGEKIDIRCAFIGDEETLRYDIHLSIRVAHVLAAAIRFMWKEAARIVPKTSTVE